MRIDRKKIAGSAIACAVVGGLMFAGMGSASAATTPTYEPDALSAGPITLYDAGGNVVTSGSINSPLAAYYAGSGGATAGSTPPDNLFAQAFYYQPSNNPDPSQWNNDTVTGGENYGVATSATYPGPLHNSPNAIVKGVPSDETIATFIANFPLNQRASDPNILSLRIQTGDPNKYYSSDIQVTGNTWAQIYPAPAVTTTVAAIGASPASPAPHGSSVALTSTVSASDSSHPTGTVELFDGATDAGAATFTASTGAISKTVTPADGAHNYKFVFTSTTTGVTGNSSPVLAYTVNAPAPAANTATTVNGSATGTVNSPSTYTAVVTSGTPAAAVPAGSGKVQFSVDGTATGAPVTVTGSGAPFQYTPTDTHPHKITAAFTPTNPAVYNPSSDTTGVTLTATAPLYAADPQTVDVTVPAGTLVISTPYTAGNPLHLGNLVLSPDGTSLSTVPVAFGDPSAPAAADPGPNASVTNGVTITDTRTGSTGWTASAQTTNFTNTSSSNINGDLLAFTNVTPKYITGNHLQSGSVVTQDIVGFSTAKKDFAVTTQGPGTVNITGKMSLTGVPTSVLPGTYTATVTFTIG